MINSDDLEIAVLGATLALQENEEIAKRLKINKVMHFYKTLKGNYINFYNYKYLRQFSDKGYLYLVDLNYYHSIIKTGFRNAIPEPIKEILQHNEETGELREISEI